MIGNTAQNESGAMVVISHEQPIDSVGVNLQDGSFGFHGIRIGNYDLTIGAANSRIYQRSNVVVNGTSHFINTQ